MTTLQEILLENRRGEIESEIERSGCVRREGDAVGAAIIAKIMYGYPLPATMAKNFCMVTPSRAVIRAGMQ